jgi:hypothetical protein
MNFKIFHDIIDTYKLVSVSKKVIKHLISTESL